jgi:hypothetical protein
MLSAVFANDLLKLILNGTAIANIADNAASGALTVLYVALHSADPGASGVQNTNEISYPQYGRVSVARTSGGWAISGNIGTPVVSIDFPKMTSGTAGTATYMSIGVAATGGAKILARGGIAPTIPFSIGTTPRLENTTQVVFQTS